MNNLLKVEWYKLQRNKSFWVITLTVSALSVLFHCLIITEWWMMSGTPFDAAGLGELNGLGVFTVPFIFNLIVASLAGFFISAEFSNNGMIRTQMMSGHNRTKIYLAKYLIFSCGSLMITVLIPLITALVIVSAFGYTEIWSMENLQFLGRAYSLFTIQFLGYTAIIMLLSIITEESGKTILFSILLNIVMIGMQQFPSGSIVGVIYNYSIFQQFSDVFTSMIPGREQIKAIVIGLWTIFVITVCGMFLFNRKEIK